jgi:DNA-binding transcriptional ArsR family regulator
LTVPVATCQSPLTGDSRANEEAALNTEELLAALGAVGHTQRLRVIAELYTAEQNGARVHVSELARRLGLSRPLLYMHLERLESAGLVRGNLELSEDGKAMKYFELVPFAVTLDAETITAAVRQDAAQA